MERSREAAETPGEREHLTLKALGTTLLGVIASIGVTVGFGISADWWIRVAAGVVVSVVLVVGVKLLSASPRGPLGRLAEWLISRPELR